ncbi:hypothetical protein AeMF1_017135 [Aphanomyces euteiches]|nr:hypothetical protein AeMF1_017135 [Aphanomyces euteiches]KAH9192353.1 hypothetical protein AeNC1_005667 [Aphanomyces euteiches]
MGQLGSFNLLDAVLPNNYSQWVTFIDLRPAVNRRLPLDAISLDVSETIIRATTLYENMHTVVPYFWVDFDRRFEIAHTAQRHLRCAVHRKEKDAVDLETLLRNVNSKDLTQSSFGIQTNPTTFMPLMLLDSGPDASALIVGERSRSVATSWIDALLNPFSKSVRLCC